MLRQKKKKTERKHP